MGTLVMDQGIMTLVTVAVIAICAALALYIVYSVIWRAVRRGLREFHQPTPAHASRTARVPRAAAVRVPDYLPRDWV
ncbi:MAG: hypothetical protein M3N46_04920 [Actinomycetota bacterium]|nr:hypothetical protein [Actinomycetota bacterium]